MKLDWNMFQHQSVWNLNAMSTFQTHSIFLMYEKQKNIWFSDVQFEIVWFPLFWALEQDIWNLDESV